ncbi:hypothetical protein ABZ092_32770 [Streptomyces bobili]|uniref:SDH family Clp fold serine proteinase n=1 Tax=Streptomyces bobili TaxID=67280 RepID=UPI0033A3A173
MSVSLAGGGSKYVKLTPEDLKRINQAGVDFRDQNNNRNCLLISGTLGMSDDPKLITENLVAAYCQEKFGYPKTSASEQIDVILDSLGGSLDSAFRIVRYLGSYSTDLRVYVPRQAKSAATLIALGTRSLLMSPFSELGPLDSQIKDPRNPADRMSALDGYQSVDYVRGFGLATLREAIWKVADATHGRMPLMDLLKISCDFAIGGVNPVLSQMNALDFGSWGRSLNIGEKYAQILVRNSTGDVPLSERIANRLVYGYKHHLFPIDCSEAADIGLSPAIMTAQQYKSSLAAVEACHDGCYVGFIGDSVSTETRKTEQTEGQKHDER